MKNENKKQNKKNNIIKIIVIIFFIIIVLTLLFIIYCIKISNKKIIINAEELSKNASIYYGLDVKYLTGDSQIDSKVNWKIFHSDGKNIYLITEDYITSDLCPSSTKYKVINDKESDGIKFGNVLDEYNGSDDIIDVRLQNLNSKYFKYLVENNLKSFNSNMKAVAYMLDSSVSVWGKYANEKADFAIASPTIELFLDSYNNKYNENYQFYVDNLIGYLMFPEQKNEKFMSVIRGIQINTFDDDLYFTKKQNIKDDTLEHFSFWLASPSISRKMSLLSINSKGYITFDTICDLDNGIKEAQLAVNCGLRPVVCLNSNVSLKYTDDGFEIL